MTASRPWLGISTPPWLIKSDTPQSPTAEPPPSAIGAPAGVLIRRDVPARAVTLTGRPGPARATG